MTPRARMLASLALLGTIPIGIVSASTRETRTTIIHEESAAAIPRVQLSCAGGQEYPVGIDIVPDAVVSQNGRESIEYHAELYNPHATEAAIAWSAWLVDDSGKQRSVLDSSQVSAPAAASVTSKPLRPGALPDGAYMLRVVAASVSSESQGVVESAQPFRVTNGKVEEITLDEWATSTRARETISIPTRPTASMQFPKRQAQPAGTVLPPPPPARTPTVGRKGGRP